MRRRIHNSYTARKEYSGNIHIHIKDSILKSYYHLERSVLNLKLSAFDISALSEFNSEY